MKFKPTNCIAIDVDGTLLIGGNLNHPLAEWADKKKAEGFEVLLWSARGREHAVRTAERFGITDTFSAIISKPGYIVDDKGWSWIKYTKIVKAFNEI